MDTEQQEASPPRGPLQLWQRISWRWKMTLVGAAMGAFASSLWTAPAAYFALSNGHMAHGITYVVVTVIGVAGAAGIMHILGIRQERDLNATD